MIYTVEFQKRGLPHAHILVFLHSNSKYRHPDDIDKIISAEIPNKYDDPELFEVVTSFMIHGPCGSQNPKSPCMRNGKCTKYFPKKIVDKTALDPDGYPLYRRRDTGVYVKKGESFLDNRYVVSYNKTLLLKYNSHINVEWCNQARSIKYLFKFINKGHNRVTTTFYNSSQGTKDSECVDEIKMYYDCRYLSSCEAAWRIFSFDIHHREPAVERLPFHLPNEQCVVFGDDDHIESVLDKQNISNTKFLAWMDANKRYPEAKKITYSQFPLKFVWKENENQWCPRKKGSSIGRLHFTPLGAGEIYYLRTLLNYVKGPECYEDIRTVKNVVHPTFKAACCAMGLLDDDKEYIHAIIEASHWGTGDCLRKLFASLLMSNQISRPEFVWDATWKYLCDDILHRQRLLLPFQG